MGGEPSGFSAAFGAHGAGRLDEAERGYRAVLAVDPKHVDAWHLLGVIAQQRGQAAQAVEYITRALKLSGPQGAYLGNLGVAYEALGRSADAAVALEQAVALESSSFTAQFALANALTSLGRLDEAVERYGRALALQPHSASAHNNLGNALQALGRNNEAAAHYRQTIALQPTHGRAHYNLGVVLKNAKKLPEAADSFRRALALIPDLAEAHVNLGAVLHDLGQLEDAVHHARTAIKLNPKDADAVDALCLSLCERGRRHKKEGNIARAIEDLLEAADLRPGNAVVHNNLGNALIEVGRAPDAQKYLRQAVGLAPENPEIHYNLGNALKAQEKYDAAVSSYEAAIRLRPDFFKARINLSVVLQKLEKYDEALRNYEETALINPASAEAVNGKGLILQALGREDEALENFQRAQELKPNFAGGHRNAGLALLMRGDFKAGWEAYEWRWRCEGFEEGWRDFTYPQWQGEVGEGTILVWREQGIGDEVLYAGMIPDLLARGLGVVMETDARLVALFERSFPGVTAVAMQNPPDAATQRPDIRWHSPLGSLGRWLRPDAASFPQRESYLVPDEARRARYRAHLEAAGPGTIVGISWVSGNLKFGRHKTLDLKQWAPILQTPGVRFVDLQYGDTAAERAAVEAELGVHIEHLPDLDLREDIDGVAALAAACDLVISVSNTTVHLAAAVGRPVWVIVPASVGNLWYWMRGSDHTPWYKTVTIFRQTRAGQRQGVIAEIEARLKDSLLRSVT